VVDRWRSFDVTNGGPAGEHYIRVAVGPDYLDACPVRGVRSGGGQEKMTAAAMIARDQ
jgi:transglutaminase-like putative cysteine protease